MFLSFPNIRHILKYRIGIDNEGHIYPRLLLIKNKCEDYLIFILLSALMNWSLKGHLLLLLPGITLPVCPRNYPYRSWHPWPEPAAPWRRRHQVQQPSPPTPQPRAPPPIGRPKATALPTPTPTPVLLSARWTPLDFKLLQVVNHLLCSGKHQSLYKMFSTPGKYHFICGYQIITFFFFFNLDCR